MTFDTRERDRLGQLADILIPAAAHGALSASAAEVSGRWLDQVLIARPDLASGLKTLLQQAENHPPEDFVEKMRTADPSAFGILTEVVTGAYFMNPDVQKSIGYADQTQHPIGPTPDYLENGLLDSVIHRGPIYRPTPS